ncbi:16S rRNA (guanine(527)-N(7))-methyltransferase RsmG [Isachenkonia alkalipeptolytica]|uniref:Ribosomal RNA small subunit methyltransferase G n=1 Tax=Isachenkonia alkalipeptolytica TaxID=2565777 RepID=A0AA44BEE3_9CLOT|nr:16S rRNA (guanine(527)-N(7))-methyltransferase RsmG [Isachenkonia alkalipeptolytica]NBG89219.1 16S rRNA (guanine(527)-N(7))-methyltransferase RsmG [Isachenkonia alkalipeptolytica]
MFNKTLEEGHRKMFQKELSKEELEKFQTFQEELLYWNERMNLTAITDEREIAIKHMLDSLSPLKEEGVMEKGKVIDIGTGAGFPGIPLKIMRPSLEMTLLDSLQKRLNFLKGVIEKLGLENITTLHGRAEDYGRAPEHRETYDYAVSRAVARLPVLLEYALPFVKVGGFFICQKGPGVMEELEASTKALEVLGGEVVRIEEVALPFVERGHHMIMIKKTAETPKKYPRQAGKPGKSPL